MSNIIVYSKIIVFIVINEFYLKVKSLKFEEKKNAPFDKRRRYDKRYINELEVCHK